MRDTPWLAGWKDIAEYLKISVRTAQMWAAKEKMPVVKKARGCVHAERPALDEWMRNRAQPDNNITQ